METPEVLWPEKAHRIPSPAAPVRWIRWLAAGLILLMMAFIFHTKGRAAHAIQAQTRHWIVTNTHMPAFITHSPLTAIGHLRRPSGIASTPPKSHTGWVAPMKAAVQVSTFGWHGSGANAKFSPDVTMRVSKASSIIAGVTGRIRSKGHHSLTIVSGGYHIQWTGIGVNKSLKPGTRVAPATQVGQAVSRTLTLEITRDGYPVNPTMSTLYGAAWIHH